MNRTGLTLVELMVVLVVLVAAAALVVPLVGEAPREARATATRTSLETVRDAYVRLRMENPFRADGSPLTPEQIRVGDLFNRTALLKPWDPVVKTGWHGPYLAGVGSTYVFPASGIDPFGFAASHGSSPVAEPCLFDPFNHDDGHRCPIVFNHAMDGGALVVWAQSAGPNGILETPAGVPVPVENGTEIRNGGVNAVVDDLTLRVYP